MALVCGAAAGVSAAGKGVSLDSIRAKKKPVAKARPKPARPKPTRAQPPRPVAGKPSSSPKRPTAAKPTAAKPAAPLVLEVSPLGVTPYQTISAALRKATPGTKIRVRAGIYQESLVLDKPVAIEPADREGGVVVEGISGPALTNGASAASVRGFTFRLRADAKAAFCIEIPTGRLVLDGCDITGGATAAVGVSGDGTNPYLTRCRIEKTPTDGVLAAQKASPTFDQCTFINNGGAGARVTAEARPIFQGCLFQKNKADGVVASGCGPALFTQCDFIENAASGALIEAKATPTFKTCTFRSNGTHGAVSANNGSPTLEDCTMQGNTTGLQVQGGSSATARGCKFWDQRNNGVFMVEKSHVILEGCEAWGSGWHGIVITGGADAALKKCTSRDNNGSALQIHGGARGDLTDCDLANGRDWSCVVVLDVTESTFRRTRVRNSVRGGIEVANAKLVLEQCEIFANGWSGVSFTKNSEGTVRNCTIRDNQHWGVALYDAAVTTFDECDVRSNARGSLGNHTGRPPTIRASRIQ
jgi:F-box protein 11